MTRAPTSTRCLDGRTMRHDPQPHDPSLETDIGQCEECDGDGCEGEGGHTSEAERLAQIIAPYQRCYAGGKSAIDAFAGSCPTQFLKLTNLAFELLSQRDDLAGVLREIVAADDAAMAELRGMGMFPDEQIGSLTERARAALAKVSS